MRRERQRRLSIQAGTAALQHARSPGTAICGSARLVPNSGRTRSAGSEENRAIRDAEIVGGTSIVGEKAEEPAGAVRRARVILAVPDQQRNPSR